MYHVGRWISERELAEGAIIPKGWGFCRPMLYRECHCYIAPIPLNHVLGLWHWFYWRVLVRNLRVHLDPYNSLRHYWIMEGNRRGYNEGYEAGVRHALTIHRRRTRR